MRNLKVFPITHDEIIKCLEDFKAGCDDELVGDIRPMLLDAAINMVDNCRMYALREDGKFATPADIHDPEEEQL